MILITLRSLINGEGGIIIPAGRLEKIFYYCHLRVLGQNPKVKSEPLYFNDLGFRSSFRRRRTNLIGAACCIFEKVNIPFDHFFGGLFS